MNSNITKGLEIFELTYSKNPANDYLARQLIEYYSQFYDYEQALIRIKKLDNHEGLLSHPKMTAWKFSEDINLPHFNIEPQITKSIYQTCPNKNNLVDEIKQNIQKIKRLNPNYDYILFEDSDIETFIKDNYNDEILTIYNKINPIYGAARADFFRYLLIYAKGGIYLDLKSTITKSFNETIDTSTPMYLSKWPVEGWGEHPEIGRFKGGEYQQWYIIAVAGHPFLRRVIKRVIYNIQHYNPKFSGVGRKGVLRTTGPIAYTLAIGNNNSTDLYTEVEALDIGIDYTIYDNHDKHKSLNRKHYTKLKKPVVI